MLEEGKQREDFDGSNRFDEMGNDLWGETYAEHFNSKVKEHNKGLSDTQKKIEEEIIKIEEIKEMKI